MIIPMKWVPYLLIALGIFGVIIVAIYGGADTGDTIFAIVTCVFLLILNILNNIRNLTTQNKTQCIQRSCADSRIVFHTMKYIRREAMLEY